MTETRVEYAVLNDHGQDVRPVPSTRAEADLLAEQRRDFYGIPCTVVRRTVTYGEWEPVE